MDGSWWRVLTKCGPLEKGMANHFSILALRIPQDSMVLHFASLEKDQNSKLSTEFVCFHTTVKPKD